MNGISKGEPMTLVAVSGGYDPLHIGHVRQFQHAAQLGDLVMVFLNSDAWLDRKKGYHCMSWEARREILQGLRWIDLVVPVDDTDNTCASAIRLYRPTIYAKGGDRTEPVRQELEACRAVKCQMVFGIGNKVESSSNFKRRS